MRQAVIGMLAHVDAGKTTLVEAMLYETGVLRKLGRVDHRDAFLDTDELERQRGITIFSKPAVFQYENTKITLLDAPGHVDFSGEMERILPALDYALLVIEANDGMRGYTETLWRLLRQHGIPTFIFVNKLDLADASRKELLASLQKRWGEAVVDAASLYDSATQENVALSDEGALEEFLVTGAISTASLQALVSKQCIFPCFFGSALHMDGIRELLEGISHLIVQRQWPDSFSARVFKVSHDERAERLVWLKITGGTLKAKMVFEKKGEPSSRSPGLRIKQWSDKVDQIRLYSGLRYETVGELEAGGICAVSGLDHIAAGDVLGDESQIAAPILSPVLGYQVLPESSDMHAVHAALRELAEEDPLLSVSWEQELQELRVQLMGALQGEVVRDLLQRRFGITVQFGPGGILYRETIAAPSVGIGHFEPLRHYAEVQLLLEPLPRGSGVVYGSACSEDDLDRNWQRLILSNAMEREHLGVLIGVPITDLRITLLAGRAHPKHTEGGDFRQATYRAIRNALMHATSILLEPRYRFSLEVPVGCMGRALSDLQHMHATYDPPLTDGDFAIISGIVPASEVGEYPITVASYTSGRGSFAYESAGYGKCHNTEQIKADYAYDPKADVANTPDSVFCSHGSGYVVPWQDVAKHAHVDVTKTRRHPWREADESFFDSA